MLEFLRKSAGSWVAKILFGLLILSFGVWGIGDVVRGGIEDTPAIRVGDIEVTPQYVRQQFDRQVAQLRQAVGQDLTTEQARSMGFLQATVRDIVTTSTLDMAARDMGLTASEDALREVIRENPNFQNQDGSFSADRFRRTLAANNLSEDRYLALLRGDIVRQRLASALGFGVAPAPLVDPLFAYRQETRSAEALRVDAAALTVEETPTDETLRDIYDARVSLFTAPEYRQGVAVLLRQEDLADRVEVSDQDITDFYQANPDRFTTPEKRVVRQVIADSQDKAANVARLATEGASLEDAAAQAGTGAPLDMGEVAHDGLPPDAADAVFALPDGGVSDPVQTPLGWHVFAVGGLIPGSEKPLDTVRDEIRGEIAHERAVDVLYEESATLEDTLGGGATLEEAAEKLALPLVRIPAVDVDAQPRDGALPAPLAESDLGKTVVGVLFELEKGLDSRLREIPGGYVVVRVDEVTPPAPRPFDSVKDDLTALWLADQRQAKAEALAKELSDKAGGPRVFASLADGVEGVTYVQPDPVIRANARQGTRDLPAPLVQTLFDLPPGGVSWAATPDGAMVIHLTDIAAADPRAQSQALRRLEDGLRQQIGQDLLTEAVNAYGERYGVEVNNGVIERAF